MNINKEIAKFIGWLAGSIVGIGAILGAFGFIIHKSHMHLLGLGAFMEFDNEFYIQEGVKFIYVLSNNVRESFLPFLIIILIFIPLYFLLRQKFRQHSFMKRLDPFIKRVASIGERRPWLWKSVIVFGLILPLLFHLMTRLNDFRIPLTIHHLLYEEAGSVRQEMVKEAETIKQWIRNRETNRLADSFNALFLVLIESLLVLLLIRSLVQSWPARKVVLAPFIIISLTFVLLLPMAYGVLMKKPELHPINLRLRQKALLPADSHLFLLRKTDREFIVWDNTRHSVVWIAMQEIWSAEIGQKVSTFQKSRNPTGKEGGDGGSNL